MYRRLILFLLLAISFQSYSQRLLKDIATSDANSYINESMFQLSNYAIKGDTLFFLAQDTVMENYSYKNIWFTNGSAANTKKVTNGNLKNPSKPYDFLATFKGKVFYKDYSNKLYTTDGNTITLVKIFEGRNTLKAVAIDAWLYLFVENYIDHILELWKTDGTQANTTKITDISTDFYYINFDAFFSSGDKIYFNHTTNTNGSELWVTDGTPGGTQILKDIVPGSSSSTPYGFVKVENTVFFIANDTNSQRKLWKTDGTEAGTILVSNAIDENENYWPNIRICYGNNLYFTANTDKLYKTDGNTVTLVKADLTVYSDIVKVNNLMYFIRQNEAEFELWKSDGSTAGTEKIKALVNTPDFRVAIARMLGGTSKIYFELSTFSNSKFQNITQHWVSDGTTDGTININTLNTNFSTGAFTNQLAVVDDTYYFTAFDAANGFELWKSNGTPVGTYMVSNINKSITSSNPSNFIALNNDVYFAADDIKHGRELWKTDGTAANTNFVMDINAGIEPDVNYHSAFSGMIVYNGAILANVSSDLIKFSQTFPPTFLYQRNAWNGAFVNFNNKIFYKSSDDTGPGIALFKTDGNTVNKVKNLSTSYPSEPTAFTIYGEKFYFTAFNNSRIWESDGTEAGTVLVKDFGVGTIESKFYEVNGLLLFTYQNPALGLELWKTDGTEVGTVLVKEINPGSGGAGIRNLVVYNNTLFFTAYDGSGNYLYKSDGSSANTQVFSSNASINLPVVFKNKLFFISHEFVISPDFVYCLWATDGVSAPVKIKQVGDKQIFYPELTLLKNIDDKLLIFDVVPNSSRHELWTSDGTTGGTKLSRVIRQKESDNPAPNITEYLYHNNKLYFAADDGIHGKELWIWDANCPEYMTITNPISQNTEVLVDKYIVGTNKVNPAIEVYFNANKYITMNPGFETQAGSRFTASINGCINLPASPAITTNSNITSDATTQTGKPVFGNVSTTANAMPGIFQFLNEPLNAELRSAYISEKNKHTDQNIVWIFDESPKKYILKMLVNGKKLTGYLPK